MVAGNGVKDCGEAAVGHEFRTQRYGFGKGREAGRGLRMDASKSRVTFRSQRRHALLKNETIMAKFTKPDATQTFECTIRVPHRQYPSPPHPASTTTPRGSIILILCFSTWQYHLCTNVSRRHGCIPSYLIITLSHHLVLGHDTFPTPIYYTPFLACLNEANNSL